VYGRIGTAGATGGTLALTGFNTFWTVVAGATLLLAGAALMRLTPKRR
jgi:hypothetical protein